MNSTETNRISIPYNIYKTPLGTIGIDSYFWTKTQIPYAKTLLVKPVKELKDSPQPSSHILNTLIRPQDQIAEIDSLLLEIKSMKLEKTMKYHRWRLARFFLIPLPTPTSGLRELSEIIYAEKILRGIRPLEPLYSTRWLILEFRLDRRKPFFSDKSYEWLWINDESFRHSLLEAAGHKSRL